MNDFAAELGIAEGDLIELTVSECSNESRTRIFRPASGDTFTVRCVYMGQDPDMIYLHYAYASEDFVKGPVVFNDNYVTKVRMISKYDGLDR